MKCSKISRCSKPNLISFDNVSICKTCDNVFKKGTKHIKNIIINCCNDQNINYSFNIQFCNNCLKICEHKSFI